MHDEMEEIIAEFVAESEETLDGVDPLFVELEAKGDDPEILNKLFRSVHTIKGAAGFMGFQSMVDVAHNAENIMKKLREGEIKVSRQLMDAVLKAIDMLRLLLKHVREKDGIEEDVTPVVRELTEALEIAVSGSSASSEASIPETPAESVDVPAPEKPEAEEPVASAVPGSETATPEPAAAPAPAPSPSPTSAPEPQAPASPARVAQQTLRVEVAKIDKVMDLTGEIVLARNRLINITGRLEEDYPDDPTVQNLLEAISFLNLVTSDMQLGVMKMRMQPIAKVFSKFPRLVRDIAGPLGKTVELKVSGEETEVDKSVIEEIGDPMVHIIRNAVDHGMETPAERTAKGKPASGVIAISAEQKGNQIVIEVSDDGRGVDLERVKKKALEKGLISTDESVRMTDESVVEMLFLPGFSTAEVATELSGRGVGMDVVKTNISKLNGTIEITTQRDAGTTFTIRLPLTLAIIQTLMVRSGDSRYAIPLAPVEETLTVSEQEISIMGGTEALIIRGKVHPLFTLHGLMGKAVEEGSVSRYAVVVAIGEKRFCVGVDELLGQEEVVIKTVKGINTASSQILGATITGDGRVVFILDVAALSKNVYSMARV